MRSCASVGLEWEYPRRGSAPRKWWECCWQCGRQHCGGRCASVSRCPLCVLGCLRMKGPAEKLQFPTLSPTCSPYMHLPTYLMVLGKKLDNAARVKDKPSCTCSCMFFCRSGWNLSRTMPAQKSLGLMCNVFVCSRCRFNDGIQKPLDQLKIKNTELIQMQCNSLGAEGSAPSGWGRFIYEA